MNHNKPFFSIITVTKNSQKTIQDTLFSLSNQNFKDFQHIIIDGKSTDDTLNLVKNYKIYNQIIISEEDDGIYDALNKGIKLATGRFIGILHSDDIYFNDNVLQEVYEKLVNDKTIHILCGDSIYLSTNNKKFARYYSSKNFKPWMFRFGFMPSHTATFINKKVYEDCKYYHNEYKSAGDFDFFIKSIFMNRIKFDTLPIPLVIMKVGGTSTSGIKSYIRTSNEIKIILKRYSIYSNIIFIYLRLPLKFLDKVIFSIKNL